VIQLDRAQDETGVSTGLVQIVSGADEHLVGQRAVFSRDTLHVFGVHCQRADMAYFITNSERISVDQLDEIHDQVTKLQCSLRMLFQRPHLLYKNMLM
jgi:hypothetical protein